MCINVYLLFYKLYEFLILSNLNKMFFRIRRFFLGVANSNNYSRNPSIHPGRHPVYELPEPVQVPGSSWLPPPTDLLPPVTLFAPTNPLFRHFPPVPVASSSVCGAAALYFGCCRRRFWCAFSQSLWHWANARNACHMEQPELQLAGSNLQHVAPLLPLWSSAPKCGP